MHALAIARLAAFSLLASLTFNLASADSIVERMTAANDRLIEEVLVTSGSGQRAGFSGPRDLGARLQQLVHGHANAVSRFHRDSRLIPLMLELARALEASQLTSGLYDAGNLESPPDTAFAIASLCKAQTLLLRDGDAATQELRTVLERVIRRGAEGIRTGGVHTPNHRWHICATLAHINHLYPAPELVARIDEWLTEGIDLDADGQFAERSPHYTGEVVCPALMELAVLLNRPVLLDYVRRSLDSSMYLIEPNGEIETVASRRQDQRTGARQFITDDFVVYRFLAARDGNGVYAALARWIERDFFAPLIANTRNPNAAFPFLLLYPELSQELPPDASLPDDFAHVYRDMHMARIRRGDSSATIFGGSDAHAGLGVGSGLSTNPTFFKYRKGAAILESVRMTPAFFSTGFFYSEGLDARDGTCRLSQLVRVPYHLPMPPEHRAPDGNYTLSPDGRFFSKMDFANRTKQWRTLTSTVEIREREGGGFELEFNVGGHDGVPVTIELAFRKGGELSGVLPLEDELRQMGIGAGALRRFEAFSADELPDLSLLKDGTGLYRVGDDMIEFGPGSFARLPGRMESELYGWVNGRLSAEGHRVYLTGVTPLQHTIVIK